MANWEKLKVEIVIPQAATNLVPNPSFETSLIGYATVGGSSVSRIATEQRRGAWCMEIAPVDSTESGASLSSGGLSIPVTNGITYTFSVDVLGVEGQTYLAQIKCHNLAPADRAEYSFVGTGEWQRVEVSHTVNEVGALYDLYVVRDAAETGTDKFYIDGLQFEVGPATTYFDGDMTGFVPTRNDFGWNGLRHGSTSYRTAKTRKGGSLLDISDYASIVRSYGLGMGQFSQSYTDIIAGGALYEKHTRNTRPFSFVLDFNGSQNTQVTNRAAVIDAIRPDATDDQPMIVRVTGIDASGNDAGNPVDIVCWPEPSLLDSPDTPFHQRDTLRFRATDALLPGAFHEGVELDFADSLTNADHILYRDSDGVWHEIGTGSTGTVYSLAEAPNGDVWIGGSFTAIDGVSADNIAKWDGSTITAPISGINSIVYAIDFDSEGNVYFCGDFTDAGGDPNIDYLAKWDGSSLSSVGSLTLSASAFGTSLRSLKIDVLDNLYIGGLFLNAGGVADADFIAKYDGSSWSAVGTPNTGTASISSIRAIAIDNNNDVFVGGNFTNFADIANADSITKWDGSAWAALDIGTNGEVYALSFGLNGDLYAGGTFTSAGGETVNRIAKWNGSQWSPLGIGVSAPGGGGYVYTLSTLEDGSILVGGSFQEAGEIEIFDRFAIWSQETWLPLNVDLPGSPIGYASLQTSDGRIFVGYTTTGTATASGSVTATNSGGARAYPTAVISGPGLVHQLKDFTSDAQITFFNLTLLTGEVLTINLEPDNVTVESSFRGDCLNYIASGSDFADFYLQPGANNISLLMTGTDGDTEAVIYWSPTHWGIEQTKHGV